MAGHDPGLGGASHPFPVSVQKQKMAEHTADLRQILPEKQCVGFKEQDP